VADNLVTSNAVMNICGVTDFAPELSLLYVYSFLRTDFFVEQVWSMLNRGLYPRMDKGALDKIFIPIPSDRRVIRYVSALIEAIVEKEKTIRDKSSSVNSLIDSELRSHQKSIQFQFRLPLISEVSSVGRLDSAIYAERYKSNIWLIHNYANGFETPRTAGFSITPGPSLEIKILHTRIDSDTWRKGYYLLITPTNISEYGTISREQFLGTAKPLPELRKGDIIFGESGSHRSIVFLGSPYNSPITTNAHGLYARRFDNNVPKSIFFRCIYDWLYKNQVIDLLAVGGSGGHFSPAYFEALPIPKFPSDKQSEIVRLYHNPAPPPPDKPTLETFFNWHRRWNTDLGIWELDREMKVLQKVLLKVQDQIIEGKTINLPF
jgi:type I restriction enzyme S subunit